jgi:hypothetical protein
MITMSKYYFKEKKRRLHHSNGFDFLNETFIYIDRHLLATEDWKARLLFPAKDMILV